MPKLSVLSQLKFTKKMQSDTSVHDNHILSYTVSSVERRIVIQTEYPHRDLHEFTDIIFDEVLAYHFTHDLFGSIIFDVAEVELRFFLKENAAMFEEGWRHGWPRGWNKAKEGIEVYVHGLEMRAFELCSSYGMDGWVLAKHMTKQKQANTKAR